MRNATILKAVLLLAAGCTTDGLEGELDSVEQKTICGETNDAQDVNTYNGTLGPSVAFVYLNKGSKGALETVATSAASAKYCSGSLISSNLFLTAGHCVDASTVGDYVAFNYERAADGVSMLVQTHVRVDAIVEDDLGGVDYAILRLAGTPGSTFGISELASLDPVAGATITIIGHPAGQPKQIEAGSVAGTSGNYLTYGNVDTLGGSSGSGILNSSGKIVGVHTNGGCTATGGANSGVLLSKIRAVSSIL